MGRLSQIILETYSLSSEEKQLLSKKEAYASKVKDSVFNIIKDLKKNKDIAPKCEDELQSIMSQLDDEIRNLFQMKIAK